MNFRRRAAAAATVTSGAGMREDCWSEGATEALVEAWGDRFLHLNRGNLRQKDWKDVADSVNARQDAVGNPRKTSGQCKNRIDTLKKKYKLEKSKPGRSTWPFFSRIDLLVGHSPEKASLGIKVKQRNPNSSSATPPHNLLLSSWGSSRVRTNLPDAAQSSREGGGVGYGDFDGREDMDRTEEVGKIPLFGYLDIQESRKPGCGLGVFSSGDDGGGGEDRGDFREFVRAVEKIGDIYERVERSKLQQAIELERQRMEFEKEIEIQRMKVFMETQLELQRMKWRKCNSDSGKKFIADHH
ncbi:trihelix transcription factor ASIL1-like [Phalaenopsis equestris]|uniref:trihelix transcription factor ASIL1-like n=1 Tax=Phalaenopsis equestris TaxID=78828 RepID=UPI0009E37057|nr:trihelix transcription factor ASIL1-like [Phalaenopsis equestris]